MPKIAYKENKLRFNNISLVQQANKILAEYYAAGYQMTLRQLYYQLVIANLIPNNQKEYKNLGKIMNEARLCGMVDWNYLVDLTRNLESLPHWSSPENILDSAIGSFRIDKWAQQSCRIEVWIEKEALSNVAERACAKYDVPFFCCRGYASQSEMWRAAQRVISYRNKSKKDVHIIHLGDHDPSGKDMTRDISTRLSMFISSHFTIDRIALNMDQIEERDLPPNPAKETDTRAKAYIDEFGDSSWELDALKPSELTGMIQARIASFIDQKKWDEALAIEANAKEELDRCSRNWSEAQRFLKTQESDGFVFI